MPRRHIDALHFYFEQIDKTINVLPLKQKSAAYAALNTSFNLF